MKVVIVMPAYCEEKVVGGVIRQLKKKKYSSVVVIDDGSNDKTTEISVKEGATVYRHVLNRGLGGALGTGLKAGIQEGADIIVTMDSDGQHDVNDIKKMVAPILKGDVDVVIGSRLMNPKGMPMIRKIGNWGFNYITYLLFGVWTTDSQSGFRAFSRDAAQRIKIKTNRMEVSSEFFSEIKRNRLKFKEVPIKVIYTDYSLEHGQSSWNAFRILYKLILRRLMQ